MSAFTLFLLARENFTPSQYNTLFHQEIEALLPKLKDAKQRQHVEGLRDFDFTGYILASLRNAGFQGQEAEDRAHEIVVRLLVAPGNLFRGYDEARHGPLIARYKVAVKNGIRNIVAKERNQRHADGLFPPFAIRWLPEQDGDLIFDFRLFVRDRLGGLGAAVFDARMAGNPLKPLVGAADLGRPTAYLIKTMVRRLKRLAVEFGQAHGSPEFVNRVEAAIDKEAQQRRTPKD